mmetsp:Transcript_28062/g.52622  ORF Transcript_28062/g.52622 Transcript_28062/m.52622 type:complete len:132 (+) Transcript_28062:64-459(+)
MGQGPVNTACSCCFTRSSEPQFFSSAPTRRNLVAPEMSPDIFNTRPALPRQMPFTGPCIVCRQVAADTVCLPCGHLLVCFRCSQRYEIAEGVFHPDTRCPMCKQSVQRFQKALLPSQVAEARSIGPAALRT